MCIIIVYRNMCGIIVNAQSVDVSLKFECWCICHDRYFKPRLQLKVCYDSNSGIWSAGHNKRRRDFVFMYFMQWLQSE